MARHGIGALLVATPHLGAFASGARRVQVAGSGGTLPWVVVPAGALSATVFTPDPDGAPPWMPPTAVEPLCWDRERQLARIRAVVEPTRGMLACDVLTPELRALASALGRPLVDAVALLAEAAAPRTTGEITAIVQALTAARAAVRAATRNAHRTTVAALAAGTAATMSGAGSGFPLAEILVWRVGPTFTRLPSDAVVDDGDVMAFQVGLYLGGHAGVAGDTVGAGGDRLGSRRRVWSTALCAIAGSCRAGASTTAVRDTARNAGAGQVGLLAHGLGVGVEPPSIDLEAGDAAPLAAGTVLVLAPVVDGFRATRTLLVTDGAPRWLEPAP